jgi:diaminopropionate ammonia-lyase
MGVNRYHLESGHASSAFHLSALWLIFRKDQGRIGLNLQLSCCKNVRLNNAGGRWMIPHFVLNPRTTHALPDLATRALLGCDAPMRVRQFLSLCPRHNVTPLHVLDGLAASLGVGQILAKDEGQRLGLKSFKALGGAYAVAHCVRDWATVALDREVMPQELQSAEVRAAVAGQTVTCATDGNHGRSVAAGARLFGCRAVIFVHPHVSSERRDAMAAFGAEIIEVAGSYDDSVAACARIAGEKGWQIVSDTSWVGYTHIPGLVMQGYTVMVDEMLAQCGAPPTHVFVQGGVGGLAAAVAAHLADRLGKVRPKLIVTEPEAANCLLQSAIAGQATQITSGRSTIMGMLECYKPSDMAWAILDKHADAFMDLPEEIAPQTMRRLAYPLGDDPAIIAGESGGAGLSGVMIAAVDPHMRATLGLDATSRVAVFITEGATAPSIYRDIVGHGSGLISAPVGL